VTHGDRHNPKIPSSPARPTFQRHEWPEDGTGLLGRLGGGRSGASRMRQVECEPVKSAAEDWRVHLTLMSQSVPPPLKRCIWGPRLTAAAPARWAACQTIFLCAVVCTRALPCRQNCNPSAGHQSRAKGSQGSRPMWKIPANVATTEHPTTARSSQSLSRCRRESFAALGWPGGSHWSRCLRDPASMLQL